MIDQDTIDQIDDDPPMFQILQRDAGQLKWRFCAHGAAWGFSEAQPMLELIRRSGGEYRLISLYPIKPVQEPNQ